VIFGYIKNIRISLRDSNQRTSFVLNVKHTSRRLTVLPSGDVKRAHCGRLQCGEHRRRRLYLTEARGFWLRRCMLWIAMKIFMAVESGSLTRRYYRLLQHSLNAAEHDHFTNNMHHLLYTFSRTFLDSKNCWQRKKWFLRMNRNEYCSFLIPESL